ncbi:MULTISPECIES: ATP synthase subunit I [Geobacillus]|jgi:ATP synthase protein I|uniref:ATP synthase subunit i n=2 Tax=Geobacillus thermodenitrificans TaxID=33940 RepID=A4ITJ6_GEOTN|nr:MULTISPECIES: ATP synthase subunit I [Geobacillus]ABO68650.1 ATP synthase subunit i [Geobacillus thermodenitrificans NG80-2]ARA98274.1 hypothetical protein GD3902_09675 [Geobacillus thermodenitrificans]ARP44384.1 ATP synthase protein I [Geobacillus thermodenitrificans]ATO37635.1 hypothetical protein GTID1_10780 [Geobacillus thermodenitrificans]KQB91583.1 ATP synthase subunit I [Geobacillus sp. PA-3]
MLDMIVKRMQKQLFILMACYALGSIWTKYEAWFFSLLVGTAAGLYSIRLLARRVIKVGEAIADGRRPPSLGTMVRFALAIAVALLVSRYPQHLSMVPVVIGLSTPYILLVVNHFLHNDQSVT